MDSTLNTIINFLGLLVLPACVFIAKLWNKTYLHEREIAVINRRLDDKNSDIQSLDAKIDEMRENLAEINIKLDYIQNPPARTSDR